MSYRYILRYLIDPRFEAEARIEELVHFCVKSRVEEVMLFLAAEELSAGYPLEQELSDFITLAQNLKRRLTSEGIALSLNPWATLYHSPRGRVLREGQNFRLMVGESGQQSLISPCPLCPQWQEYLASTFARMVGEIEPVALWIEDDWRLINHGSILGWGGCFCDEHLRRFSELADRSVSREELQAAIFRVGPVHPYRKIWLDLSRDSLLEPLRKVVSRMRDVSPSVQIGLMSGNPDLHAAEGRDWHLLQEVTANGSPFIGRPSMKPYTQHHALATPPSLTRLTISHLHGKIEIYPELENSPRCGAYSKSRAYSAWQIFHSALIGSAGITINHYDMLGNGISLDPHFGEMLTELKPRLNRLRELEIDDRVSGGVRILFSPEIAYHRRLSTSNGRMAGLSQPTTLWADTCAILGISYRFDSTAGDQRELYLLNQQTLRCFSNEAIRDLLSCAVVLDAESAAILLERGFGELIGLHGVQTRRLDEAGYAYEQIVAERFCPRGESPALPRMSAQRCSPTLAEFAPVDGAEILTEVFTADHQRLWPGAVLFRNPLGGRILSITYPLNGEGQFFMGFFNVYRRDLLQLVFAEMAPNSAFTAVANVPMHTYSAPVKDGILLAALNPTDDDTDEVIWRMPDQDFSQGNWQVLSTAGNWLPITVTPHKESATTLLLEFPVKVKALDGVFLRFINKALSPKAL